MDRDHRCKYFKWADEEHNVLNVMQLKNEMSNSKRSIESSGSSCDELSVNKVDPALKLVLWNIINDRKQPLQQRLCSLLQKFFNKLERENEDIVTEKETHNDKMLKFTTILKRNEEKNNSNQQTKLLQLVPKQKLILHHKYDDVKHACRDDPKLSQLSVNEISIVEASLDLMSKIAMTALRGSDNPQSSWEGWFALLCEIISSKASYQLRAQAKNMMKKLCGSRNAVYHQIRDQYVFGFQFMKLLLCCEAPLRAGLDVREKARRCGSQWRLADLIWETLPTGGLIGVQELISEDNYPVMKMENASKIFEDLIATARSRGRNWRHFCALEKIPQKTNVVIDISERSPISLLLWMACSLLPQHQVSALQLMDIALCTTSQKREVMSPDVSKGATNIDGIPNNEVEKDLPVDVLLGGASGMTLDDIHAFIISFILNGQNIEVRTLASNVCIKIMSCTPTPWIECLLRRLISILSTDVGFLGCEAIEFLHFLLKLASNIEIMKDLNVTNVFEAVIALFTKQINDTQDLILTKESSAFKLDSRYQNDENMAFDFASCVHCQRVINHCKIKPNSAKPNVAEVTNSRGSEILSTSKDCNQTDTTRVAESTKRRLDSLTMNTISSEFSFHVQLKHRMTITEVHLNVSDPRGRFAKSIGVYFSPRPVKDINDLKQTEYSPLWQRVGTLALPRGGNKVSLTLPCPINAANLKFEYEEFYEKLSNNRPSGAIIIHCPRCTRVVNHAHGGVCGNCGEVVSSILNQTIE